MDALIADIQRPGLVQALATPLHASLWELARRLARPAEASEFAAMAQRDPDDVQRGLDALVDAGLLEKLPVRADRRHPTYRTRYESLIVTFDPNDPAQIQTAESIGGRYLDHGRSQIDSFLDGDRNGSGKTRPGWRHQSYCTARLSAEDIGELRRRIRAVHDFLAGLQSQLKGVAPDDPPHCNVQVLVQVLPTDPPALPLPEVRVVPHHLVHEAREAASSNGMHLLSARERQVAIQLARGMSRPEVARELGVSVNTVATISKRIYAKLGVRRRAELPSRLLGIPA